MPTVPLPNANAPTEPAPPILNTATSTPGISRPNPVIQTPTSKNEHERDSLLESMVKDTGSLDIDDDGHWDFHGHSSGMVFLKRLRQQFGDMLGQAEGIGTMLAKPRHFETMKHHLDSPRAADSPMEVDCDLPAKEYARYLCGLAMGDACSLMRFMHRPTFWLAFQRIYDTPTEQWENEEHRNLPLLYAMLAVGSMFAKESDSKFQEQGYMGTLDNG